MLFSHTLLSVQWDNSTTCPQRVWACARWWRLAPMPWHHQSTNRQCFTFVPQRTPNPMRRPLFPCNGTMARAYSEFGRALGGGGCGEVPQCCSGTWPRPEPQPGPGRWILGTNVLVVLLGMVRTCTLARPCEHRLHGIMQPDLSLFTSYLSCL